MSHIPFSLTKTRSVRQVNNIFPRENVFPLGLYSISSLTSSLISHSETVGYNLIQQYGTQPTQQALPASAVNSNLFTFTQLGNSNAQNYPEQYYTDALSNISALVALQQVGWWSLPEELRYWYPKELTLLQNLTTLTRQSDPSKRPNFMYMPGHYTSSAVEHYIPYLDIIGAGTYANYTSMPRAWVRYRIEANIEAINSAGYSIGSDYLNGEKTPIGILQLFSVSGKPDVTPLAAYHDFYPCLASGANGILVFSYFHRNDSLTNLEAYQAYCRAAIEVSGDDNLGLALISGESIDVNLSITGGPTTTGLFTPNNMPEMPYPSINVRAMSYNGSIYIVAVNSNESGTPVTVVITDIPTSSVFAQVLFEDRVVSVSSGSIEDQFQSLGVHIYKLRN